MGILSGKEILRRIEAGVIKITPFDAQYVGTNSVDLHLGDKLLTHEQTFDDVRDERGHRVARRFSESLDPVSPDYGKPVFAENGRRLVRCPLDGALYYAIDTRHPVRTVEVPQVLGGGWLLVPGRFYLGVTIEYTETFGAVPYIDGRSSFGRNGVFAHITAGRGDNGFMGRWTVELYAPEPTVIHPGDRYFQLSFLEVVGEQTFYGQTGNSSGRYQGDLEPVASRLNTK